MNPIKVVLLYGGRSAEHDVSVLSARSIHAAASKERLTMIPICVARDGVFIEPERSAEILSGKGVGTSGEPSFSFERWLRESSIDIVFPIIHGTFGEDGTIQGFLETLQVPYVGSGVTASAVGMDKSMMKFAFAAARLPIVEFVTIAETDWKRERERLVRGIENSLRLPYFVKPANAGSSVGVSKVKNDAELAAAVEKAFRFDEKALVERGIDAREIELSVLGNDDPKASVPGEIVTGREFYDYEDKYIENKSSLIIPAKLAADKIAELQRIAVAAFKAIGACGFARVDFFVERGTNRIYLNEINTVPGFTKISMFPKLWEATELKYGRLIEKLIELGLERSRQRAARFETMMTFFDDVERLK